MWVDQHNRGIFDFTFERVSKHEHHHHRQANNDEERLPIAQNVVKLFGGYSNKAIRVHCFPECLLAKAKNILAQTMIEHAKMTVQLSMNLWKFLATCTMHFCVFMSVSLVLPQLRRPLAKMRRCDVLLIQAGFLSRQLSHPLRNMHGGSILLHPCNA